jgi:hypothetical protein
MGGGTGTLSYQNKINGEHSATSTTILGTTLHIMQPLQALYTLKVTDSMVVQLQLRSSY